MNDGWLKSFGNQEEKENDRIAFYNYVLENRDESIAYYSHVWKSGFRDSWFPYYNLSMIYSAKGQYGEAEQCFRFALENIEKKPV